jgi:hypothetical protein
VRYYPVTGRLGRALPEVEVPQIGPSDKEIGILLVFYE